MSIPDQKTVVGHISSPGTFKGSAHQGTVVSARVQNHSPLNGDFGDTALIAENTRRAEKAEKAANDAAATATQKAAEAGEHDILTQTSLTDVQKATARTNINAAKPDGVYELIETITLTEDTASVVRTQEPDGTAYKLKAIGVVVSAEIGSVSSGINMLANYNATSLTTLFINGAISTLVKKYGYVQIYPDFGVWTGIGSTSVNNFSWTAIQMTGYSPKQAFAVKESENPYCTQMVMQVNVSDATIPAGTVISIYGVRA